MGILYATSEDLSKFAKYIPLTDEFLVQLLKGHLLVEELVRDLFKLKLNNPSALKGNQGASFDCHQIICLVEAMSETNDESKWIWGSAKKLNKIRNDLAHQLDPKGFEHKLNDFLKLVQNSSPHFMEFKRNINVPERTQIYGALLALCSELSGLKEQIESEA